MAIDLSTDNITYNNPYPNLIVEKNVVSNCKDITLNCQLTYTIILNNVSSVNLESVSVIEDIIYGLRYELNSLSINGLSPIGGDINLNKEAIIHIGSIRANSQIKIVFKVIIDEVPTQYPISNYVRVLYKYYDKNQVVQEIQTSNNVLNYFTLPRNESGFVQYVDGDNVATKGLSDDVQFKIFIQPFNTIEDCILSDYLNKSLNFVSAQIIYNDTSKNTLYENSKGLSLGTITNQDKVEIIINAKLKDTLDEIPNPHFVNKPTLKYILSKNKVASSYFANPVYIYVKTAYIRSFTNVDKSNVNVGDEIVFSINLKNFGTVPAEDVVINNILPNSLHYIKNSASILYSELLKCSIDYNSDDNNVIIPIIDIGEEVIVSVNAKVLPPTSKSNNTITNNVFLNYSYLKYPNEEDYSSQYELVKGEPILKNAKKYSNSADLLSTLNKKATSTCECQCNNIDYVISFTNTGDLPACDICIEDFLENAFFEVASLKILTNKHPNTKPYCGKFPEITIKEVCPDETITIYFSATIDKNSPTKEVKNYAKLCYQYFKCDCNYPIYVEGRTNTVITPIEEEKITSSLTNSLGVTKLVTPSTIYPGQTLLYSVDIKNLISSPINNVVLQDTIPQGTSLVPSSFTVNLEPFTINGNPVTSNNLAQGVNIGSITVSDHSTAQYLVTVNTTSVVNPIVNTANVTFTSETIVSKTYSSTISTTIADNCPSPCPPCPTTCPNPVPCPLPCDRPCPHYGKPSCRPGRRQICKQNVDCYKECSSYKTYR